MRKLFFSSLIVVLAAMSSYAQEQLDFNRPAIKPVMSDSKVTSGHSISLSLIGIEYCYEQHLGGNWSLIGRAGLPSTLTVASHYIQEGSGKYEFQWNPSPGITVEPRYYTNLQRRYDRGRKTINNSADFVSLQLKSYYRQGGINSLQSSESYYYLGGSFQLSAIAAYGLRRGGKHWYREYTCGVAFHTIWGGVLPHFGFKFGYRF